LATNSPARITIILGWFSLNFTSRKLTCWLTFTFLKMKHFFFVLGIFITKSFFNRHSSLNLAFNAQSPCTLVSNGGNKHYHEAKCVIIHRHFELGGLWLIFQFYLSPSNLNWILLFMIAGVDLSRMFWRIEAQVWNLFQV
jgi:hypothetical protein